MCVRGGVRVVGLSELEWDGDTLSQQRGADCFLVLSSPTETARKTQDVRGSVVPSE